jgi:hypothetical protein
MIALLIGVVLVLFAVFAVLPFPWALNWWPDVVQFLKGGVPLVAVFIGLISFFVGVADIKDKIESKKEEEEEEEEEEAAPKAPAAKAEPAEKPETSRSPRTKKPAASRSKSAQK